MSSWSATQRASPASSAEQQPFLRSAPSSSGPCTPVRMKRPITSKPCSLRRWAATELSTPPLMARTTRFDMPRELFGYGLRLAPVAEPRRTGPSSVYLLRAHEPEGAALFGHDNAVVKLHNAAFAQDAPTFERDIGAFRGAEVRREVGQELNRLSGSEE